MDQWDLWWMLPSRPVCADYTHQTHDGLHSRPPPHPSPKLPSAPIAAQEVEERICAAVETDHRLPRLEGDEGHVEEMTVCGQVDPHKQVGGASNVIRHKTHHEYETHDQQHVDGRVAHTGRPCVRNPVRGPTTKFSHGGAVARDDDEKWDQEKQRRLETARKGSTL